MGKEESSVCSNKSKFINQPIFVAIVSSLIFGCVVSWVGSKFQYNTLKSLQDVAYACSFF